MSFKQLILLFIAAFASNVSFSQVGYEYNMLNFDGIDDHVNLNVLQQTMYNNRDAFTIEFWMRGLASEQTSSIRTSLFAINEPTGENRLLIIMGGPSAQDGNLMIYGDGGAGANTLYTSSIQIGDGFCHHIAYSFDGSIGSVYIDGDLVNTHTTSYGITANDRYSLGQEYDNSFTSQFFNGDMDEVRIWGVARTPAEIQATMYQLNGTETDLLANYTFNQGISGGSNPLVTSLDDWTSAGLDGTLHFFTLNGPESNWVTNNCSYAGVNNALNFNGIYSYVDLNVLQPTMFANKDHFTIEFWMKALTENQTSSIRTAMFAINEPVGENRFHMILGGPATQDGKLMIYGDGGSGAGSLYTSSQEIGDGICHHIAYSYDGTNGNVYIDGQLVNTHTTSYGITANDRYSLGQEYDLLETSQFYNGDLDEIRIWGTARTLTEIQTNMNQSLTGAELGLLAYYNCNQGIPGGVNIGVTNLDDITPANLDGTLIDFSLTGNVSNWVLNSCESTTSLDESLMPTITVFPNPTTASCTINADQLEDAVVYVYSVLGEMIVERSAETFPLNVDFSDHPSGVYFVRIVAKEGEYATKIVLE